MSSDAAHRAAVLGAGSWGTALAIHLGDRGRDVQLWGRDSALMGEMADRRANPTYLPDVTFPDHLNPTGALDEALNGARYVILAIPSHGMRSVLREAAPHLPAGAILVSATKGIENDSLRRMSEVATEETGGRHPVVVLSGPSFAAEVARKLPTALVAASTDDAALRAVQDEFRGSTFRLYASDDVPGVEIGASLKNIIAIAAGVVESLHLGHNAMSALITRGLAEISRLAGAMGGRRETLAGLSGLGDLVLTCTGNLSRNRHVGIELGRGRALQDVLAGMRMVAEGVRTASTVVELADQFGLSMPISRTIHDVVSGRIEAADAYRGLMGSTPGHESEPG